MPNSTSHSDPLLISYLSLRRTVGMLGIILPAILMIGVYIFGHCYFVQQTISSYYFTIMGNVFVGIICSIAIFLLSYKGYEIKDRIASAIAGICALGVAFFPTSVNTDTSCILVELQDNASRITAHYISASLFFISLAYMSICLFTKSSGIKTAQKQNRNKVYIACGVTILVAIVAIFIVQKSSYLFAILHPYKIVFWLEWLALFAFGISWLTKGELLLPDPTEEAVK